MLGTFMAAARAARAAGTAPPKFDEFGQPQATAEPTARELLAGRSLVIPLQLHHEIDEQPVYDTWAQRQERQKQQELRAEAFRNSHPLSLLARQEQASYDTGNNSLQEYGQHRAEEIQARLDANKFQQQANQAREQAAAQTEQQGLQAMRDNLRPDTPSAPFLQAVAYRGVRDPSQIMNEARDAEAASRVQQFHDWFAHATPEEQDALPALHMGLVKEGIPAQDYQNVVQAAHKNDDSVYQYDQGLRQKASNVLAATQPDAPHDTIPTDVKPLSSDQPNTLERIGGIAKGIWNAPTEAIGGALEGITQHPGEIAAGVGQVAKGAGELGLGAADFLVKGNTDETMRGLHDIFGGEQAAITPVTRPAVQKGLESLGVPEGARDWIDRNVVPYIVPSSFLGPGEIKGVGAGGKIARALSEGTIFMLQGDAAAEQQGRQRNDWERGIDFAGGAITRGALEFGSPMVQKLLESVPHDKVQQVTELLKSERGALGGGLTPDEMDSLHQLRLLHEQGTLNDAGQRTLSQLEKRAPTIPSEAINYKIDTSLNSHFIDPKTGQVFSASEHSDLFPQLGIDINPSVPGGGIDPRLYEQGVSEALQKGYVRVGLQGGTAEFPERTAFIQAPSAAVGSKVTRMFQAMHPEIPVEEMEVRRGVTAAGEQLAGGMTTAEKNAPRGPMDQPLGGMTPEQQAAVFQKARGGEAANIPASEAAPISEEATKMADNRLRQQVAAETGAAPEAKTVPSKEQFRPENVQAVQDRVKTAQEAYDNAPRGQRGSTLADLNATKLEERRLTRAATEVQRAGEREAKLATKGTPKAIEASRSAAAAKVREQTLTEHGPLINRISSVLQGVRKLEPLRAEEITAQRKGQAAAMRGALQKAKTPEEALARTGGILKGELTKPDYAAITQEFTPEEHNTLRLGVQNYFIAQGREFDARAALVGLEKVMSGNLSSLQSHELQKLGSSLGDQFALSVASKAQQLRTTGWDHLLSAINLPRMLLAGIGDWSYMLRQGLFTALTEPKIWAQNAKMYPRSFGSEAVADAFRQTINDDARMALASSHGLSLPMYGQTLKGAEDVLEGRERGIFIEMLKKTPVLGRMFDATSRSASHFLTGIRSARWLSVVESQLSHDDLMKYVDAGVIHDTATQAKILETVNPDVLKSFAGFINETSGRGALGPLERYLGPLNALLFAPRFVASQVTRFRYVADPNVPAPVRQFAIKKLAQFYGELGTALGSMGIVGAKTGAWEVEWNPLSSDFGKIKVGKTRFDISGGLIPLIRYSAQIATGQRQPGVGPAQDLDRWTAAAQFIRSKLAPFPGIAWSLKEGSNLAGQPNTLGNISQQLYVPIFMQDVGEAWQQNTGPMAGLAFLSSMTGVGVQSYDTPTAAAERGIDSMIHEGYIDLGKYDKLPQTYGDLLPADKEQFNQQLPNLAKRVQSSQERQIEAAGSRGAQAVMGRELDLAGTEAARLVNTAAQQYRTTGNRKQFRTAVSDVMTRWGGAADAYRRAKAQMGPEQVQKQGPVFGAMGGYFDIFQRHPNATVDPNEKQLMFDELNHYMDNLDPKMQAAVQDQLHLRFMKTPEFAELTQDRQALNQAGYFERNRQAWSKMQELHPDRGLPATVDEYKNQRIQELSQRMSDVQAMRRVNRDPIIRRFNRLSTRYTRIWGREHPDELALAIKWGYKEPSRTDVQVLRRSGAPATSEPIATAPVTAGTY